MHILYSFWFVCRHSFLARRHFKWIGIWNAVNFTVYIEPKNKMKNEDNLLLLLFDRIFGFSLVEFNEFVTIETKIRNCS